MLADNFQSYGGIYRGIVVDSNDLDERGRIRVKVPQVFGDKVTGWIWSVNGSFTQANLPYGAFSSNQSQTVSAANTVTIASFNNTEDTNGVVVSNGNRIVVNETGDYFFQFSAQTAKSGSSSSQLDIWMRVNGVDLPRTNSRVTLQGNPNETLITLNYVLDLNAGDYVQVAFSSSDNSAGIVARTGLTSPSRPDIPSIIATINLIGKYVPRPNTAVWIMFEGGDPNFPVWIGSC